MTNREQEQSVGNFKPVGVLAFGPTHFIIRENDQANISLERTIPERARAYYENQTQNLPNESFVSFDKVDSDKVTIAQIGITTPTVKWTERTTGADEINLTYKANDAKEQKTLDLNLYEHEIHDLFLKKQGEESSASFFTINTAGHELNGIALRRNSPALVLFTPGQDGLSFSPAEGVVMFLNNVYNNISQRPTPLQIKVDERIHDALRPEREIRFTQSASERQQKIQKKVYQIQALLLAQKAEAGAGDQDPDLLRHVPFLHDQPSNGKQEKGLFSRLRGTQEEAAQHVVTLTPKLWTDLIAQPEAKLLLTAGSNALLQPKTAAQPINVSRPAVTERRPEPIQQPSSAPRNIYERQTPKMKRTAEPYVQPSSEQTTPRDMQKEQAKALARPLQVGIDQTTRFFENNNLKPATLSIAEVNQLGAELDKLILAAEAYQAQRPGGNEVQNPVMQPVKVLQDTLIVAGMRDKTVFEFLTGEVDANYMQKINTAFGAWKKYIEPFYIEGSKEDRSLHALRSNGKFMQEMPEIAGRMRDEVTRAIEKDLGRAEARKDANTADVAHILLGEQIMYTLHAQYRQLEAKGKADEIDNWVNFSAQVIKRLKNLVPKAIEEKKRRQSGM